MSLFLTQAVEASLPKKVLRKLLSIPITSKPLLQKKSTDSEPTKPEEPVIITTDIKNIYLILIYYLLTNHKYH